MAARCGTRAEIEATLPMCLVNFHVPPSALGAASLPCLLFWTSISFALVLLLWSLEVCIEGLANCYWKTLVIQRIIRIIFF